MRGDSRARLGAGSVRLGLVCALALAAAACGKASDGAAALKTEKPVMTSEQLFEATRPSIVLVRSTAAGDAPVGPPESEDCQHRPAGGGSGFVIDDKGHILTNAHVVQPCPQSWPKASLSVELAGGKKVDARLVGLDHLADIAVLEAADTSGLGAPLPFADSDAVKTGAEVVAIGYPSFLQLGEEPTLSRGVVSTPSRSFATIGSGVQTDAAINHGNSGGPLLNMHGEVVGVNTIIFGRDVKVENINLAISAKVAQRVSSDILRYGQAKRAFIGDIAMLAIDEDRSVGMAEKEKRYISTGMMVLAVDPNAPATGKIKSCDLIQKIDGKPIHSDGDMYNALLWAKSGQPMQIDYLRYPVQKCQDVPPCAGKNSPATAMGTGCPMDMAAAGKAPDGSNAGAVAGYISLEYLVAANQQRAIDEQAQRIVEAYSAEGAAGSVTLTPK